ncbi:MAG: hypothetical protein HDQ87_06965 [Clostridia bacterium]|nr:hypothetical protein [Clostridia bacterium]
MTAQPEAENGTLLHTLLRAFFTILGAMAIPGVVMLIQVLYEYLRGADLFANLPAWAPLVIYMTCGCGSALVFYYLSNSLAAAVEAGLKRMKKTLDDTPSISLLSGGIGLIIGLIVAALFSVVIGLIPIVWVSVPLTIIFYIIFGYLGTSIGLDRRRDVSAFMANMLLVRSQDDERHPKAPPKILDASAVIDGRIFDVARVGCLDGEIVVPGFVLRELQRLADADDPLRRSRGRRGLDLLEDMRRDGSVPVTISSQEYEGVRDVDVMVVKLARDLDGEIVTTDYSLNKVASVQDIPVYNVNDLANALKPILHAGEQISVMIVRNGREEGQGVGYLDDGTMIIVEGAQDRLRETLPVVVTSVLQTSAGRLIFGRTDSGA